MTTQKTQETPKNPKPPTAEVTSAILQAIFSLQRMEKKILHVICMDAAVVLKGFDVTVMAHYKAVTGKSKKLLKTFLEANPTMSKHMTATGDKNGVLTGCLVTVRLNGSAIAVVMISSSIHKDKARECGIGCTLLPFSHTGNVGDRKDKYISEAQKPKVELLELA